MITIKPSQERAAVSAVPAAVPEPCTLVVFGASGDLARRKLVPAVFHLFNAGLLPQAFRLLGFARSDLTVAELRARLGDEVERSAGDQGGGGGTWAEFAPRVDYLRGDYEDVEAYRELGRALAGAGGAAGNRLYYLATPPQLAPAIVRNLGAAGLIGKPGAGPWTRVVIEKPFGRDLESARELNRLLAGVLHESQVFRIDHYLGKETVQNILVFRFANAIFEPLWNRNHVERVEVVATEKLLVEGRVGFYDAAGVIRDFVQNHLLEMMSLVAMEQPVSFQADPVRDEKLKVLRSLQPLAGPLVRERVVLGQYRSYRDTPGVAPDSRTPTYARLRLFIDNWRWQGVPFDLVAGKGLAERVTEVRLFFKRVPLCLFGHDQVCNRIGQNLLVLRIQPAEGIRLRFVCKVPGDRPEVENVLMDFSYDRAFRRPPPDAYARLLLEAMRGDATLFVRGDAVEAAWAFIDPVLAQSERPDFPLRFYEQGSGEML